MVRCTPRMGNRVAWPESARADGVGICIRIEGNYINNGRVRLGQPWTPPSLWHTGRYRARMPALPCREPAWVRGPYGHGPAASHRVASPSPSNRVVNPRRPPQYDRSCGAHERAIALRYGEIPGAAVHGDASAGVCFARVCVTIRFAPSPTSACRGATIAWPHSLPGFYRGTVPPAGALRDPGNGRGIPRGNAGTVVMIAGVYGSAYLDGDDAAAPVCVTRRRDPTLRNGK